MHFHYWILIIVLALYVYWYVCYHNASSLCPASLSANVQVHTRLEEAFPSKELKINPHRKPLVPALLIVSQSRSGSSFVGEIFNQRSGVAYFYEPLHPFGKCFRNNVSGVTEYLQNVLQHDFEKGHQVQMKGFSSSHQLDTSKCTKIGLCFSRCLKCSRFLSRDLKICIRSRKGYQSCPSPLNLSKLSKAIYISKLLVFKLVNLCSFSVMKSLLHDEKFNLKVLHLVRDPRAILNSQILANPKLPYPITVKIDEICKHYNELVFSKNKTIFATEKYMRVRHEDFALQPLFWTRKIYKFVNVTMNKAVARWLQSATASKNSKNLSILHPFSTSRNSEYTTKHWRRELKFNVTLLVQKQCSPALGELGYINFSSDSNQVNGKVPSYFPV